MSLDKVVGEKDELKDSNSQLNYHINDLEASMCPEGVSLAILYLL